MRRPLARLRRRPPGPVPPVAAALLALAVLGGVALRLAALSGKVTIEHDEAISYLSATCHQGLWDHVNHAHLPPFGRWVPASAWKSFLVPDRTWCFGQIGADLAHTDIHPPLYFWLLHVWVLGVRVHVWSGPALNVLIAAATTVALFGLGRRVLGRPTDAALVALAWAVSPAVVQVFAEARQYELLALVTVLFAWQALRCAEGARPRDLLGLGALAAAGALTHYDFAIVAAAVAVYLAARLGRSDRRRLAGALGAILAGYLVFTALHPDFLSSFGRERAQAEGFTPARLGDRLERTASGFAGFLVPPEWLGAVLAAALATALAGLTGWLAAAYRPGEGPPLGARRRELADPDLRDPRGPAAILFLLVAIAGATSLAYLAFLTHGLAMGPRYLAAAWPFMAFLPVLVLRRLPRRRTASATAFFVLLAAAGLASAVLLYRGPGASVDPRPVLAGSSRVLVDTVRRGVLPRVTWHLPDRTRVFAADQQYLIEHGPRWIGGLGPRALYASHLLYGDVGRQRRILAAIERGHAVSDTGRAVWGAGRLFLVVPRPPRRLAVRAALPGLVAQPPRR